MIARRKFFLACVAALFAAGGVLGQDQNKVFRPSRGGSPIGPSMIPTNENESIGPWVRTEGGGIVNEDTVRTARETVSHSTGTPEWANPKGFEADVFTFARVLFKTTPRGDDPWNYYGRIGWWVDYPDADLNFSYRLQDLTTIRSDPDCRVLKLADPTLLDFPVVYMAHVESMRLTEDETGILRRYLTNGGSLFINDTWNDLAWRNLQAEMSRVLPGREWTELTTDHPIFHCVFELKGPMTNLQVPTIQFWNRARANGDLTAPLSVRDRGPGSQEMHVRAMLDDKGHIMVLAILNSDVSDGWEREGENTDYFHTFSEKICYPLGINIVFYLMTH
jgi:hypothetical protein